MFKAKLNKSAGIVLAMLAGLSAFPALSDDSIATKDLEIGTKPLYVGNSELPMLIMLILSKDHTMFTESYTDASDIDGDGKIDYFFKPEINYYGIFDSNLCYKYISIEVGNDQWQLKNKGYFSPVNVAKIGQYSDGSRSLEFRYCDGDMWSGNLLNYVTTSRMDAVKKVLIGGERQDYSDFKPAPNNKLPKVGNDVVIGHTFITSDAHSWGKSIVSSYYHDNYKLASGAPATLCSFMPASATTDPNCSSGTSKDASSFSEGSSAFIGVRENRFVVVKPKHTGTELPIGSLERYEYLGEKKSATEQSDYLRKHAWVWNWASRESGNGILSESSMDTPDGDTQAMEVTQIAQIRVIPCPSESTPGFKATGYVRDESVCYPYKSDMGTYYVPEGLVQQRAHDNEASFGLITSGYYGFNNINTGVLRSPVHNVKDEINSDGSFAAPAGVDCNTAGGTACGVLSTINSLMISDFQEKFWWSAGKTHKCHDGSYATYQPFWDKNIECSMWGNPLGAMLLASYSYFNKGVTQNVGTESLSNTNQSSTVASVKTAQSPYAVKDKTTGEPVYNSKCQNAVNLVLSEEDNSFDNVSKQKRWENGVSMNSGGLDIAGAVHNIGELEGINGGNYFIGQTGDYNSSLDVNSESYLNGIVTLKKVTNLEKVAGLAPLGAPDFGDYSIAGVALIAAGNQPDTDVSDIKAGCKQGHGGCISNTNNVLLTTVVSMAPSVPRFSIVSDSGRKVEIAPACVTLLNGKNIRASGSYYYKSTKRFQTCGIVDFYMDFVRYGTNHNPIDMSFRINFEDSSYGTDYDQDAIVQYHLRFNEDQSKVLVTAYGYYTDSYASQHFGYSISGVDVGVSDCPSDFYNKLPGSISSCHYNWGKSTFFDIAKSLNGKKNSSGTRFPFIGVDQLGIDKQRNPDGSLVQVVEYNRGQKVRYNYDDNGTVKFVTGNIGDCRSVSDVNAGVFLPYMNFSGYCQPEVTRQFDVLADSGKSQFLPPPSLLAAKYGYGKIQTLKLNTVTGFEEPSNYYYVNDASKLASQLKSAMDSIREGKRRVSTAASFSSTNIVATGDGGTNSNYFQASFEEQNWTGELISYKVQVEDGETKIKSNAQRWRAGKSLFAQLGYIQGNYDASSNASLTGSFDSSKRNIFIEDRNGFLHLFKYCDSAAAADESSDADTSVDKTPAADGDLRCINHDMYEKFLAGNSKALGLSQFIKGDVTAQNDIVSRFVEYMRGDRSFETDEDKQITDYVKAQIDGLGYTDEFRGFRSRGSTTLYDALNPTTLIGDISSATPVYGTDSKGNAFVIFGANDGMIHVVSDKTGEELLAIIPYNMADKLSHLADPSFVSEHTQYVDGTITVSSYKAGQSGRRVLALGTYGNGAKGGYALDISDLSDVVNESGHIQPLTDTAKIQSFLKWEFDDTNNPFVGKIMRAPKVFAYKSDEADAKTRLYAVYGNGYNSIADKGGPALIFVDVLSGKFANTIYADEETLSGSTSSYSLYANLWDGGDYTNGNYKDGMSEPTLFDDDQDGNPDVIYAGDLHGNMYRLSLRKAIANDDGSGYTYSHGKLSVEGAGLEGNHRSMLNGMITASDLKRLAVCTDEKGHRLSITTAPAVINRGTLGASGVVNKTVMWGTGRYLVSNIDNKYNKSEPVNSIWMINDRGDSSESINRNSSVYVSTMDYAGVDHSGLLADYDRTKLRKLDTPVCRAKSGACTDGWILDLTPIYYGNTLMNGGEKVAFNPAEAFDRFIVNTLVPTSDPCSESAESYQYVLNPTTMKIDNVSDSASDTSNQRRFDHTATDVTIAYSSVRGRTNVIAVSAVDSSALKNDESETESSKKTTVTDVGRMATSYQVLIDNEKPW